MAEADPAVVQRTIDASVLSAKYGPEIDRESAYELLAARQIEADQEAERAAAEEAAAKEAKRQASEYAKTSTPAPSRRQPKPPPTVVEQVLGNSAFKQMGNTLIREFTRGIFGNKRR
jgi:uncharacterized protein